ncbi:uncharacterized protein LOC133839956 [Drosophila sulfurigaster albostrigata]|uniref:uncharacterized protein LOC133839956 n=1 Tax=Drosophila sulfurigaster albostrigata TaxID=89887 RepID=UPI002D21C670|nr:uncharacterized protein LOC133839956 [Drosophila sulfurigaster albostrigata]
MGKRDSLGDYSLEMQLIQKKIEHIIRSISEDKLKGVHNPRGMRELRNRLFVNLKRLLKVKLKKNKSLKKNDIGLLRKYSNKLHKWQKYLNEQQNELQEKEQKEIKLDNKMQKLSKQLKELPQTHNKRKEIPPARVIIPISGIEKNSLVKKRNRKVKFAKFTNQKRYTVPSTIIDYSRRSSSFSGPRKTLSAENSIKLRDILENIEKSTAEKKVERENISEPDLLPVRSQQFLSSHDKRLDPYFRDIRKSISAQLITNHRPESRSSSRMSTKSLSSLRLKRLKRKLQQHVNVGSGTQTPQHTVPVVIATPTHKLHISDVDALVIPKIISAGLFTQKTLKSPHWKLFQRVVAENKKSFGEEFIENVDDTTKTNLRSVHILLKDVIQGPSMLDIIADRNGILRIVRRHYMWKNLAGVYSDMSSVGVGKKEIYNVLRNQYLENIDEIFNEAMENGMALVSEKEPTISVDDLQFHNLHLTDSTENSMDVLRFKRTSASREGSIASGGSDRQSVLSLAIKDLSDVNNRYSLTNLKNIQKAHVAYFASLKKTPLEIQLQQQKNAMKKELRKQSRLQSATKECKKKQKKLQQNVDNNRLYYEPRKTCRERSILDDELQDCNCLEPLCTPKCMRCGAEMPSLDTMEVKSSSSKLSLYSIAACGKNKDLLHLTSDICDQCGFVHHQRSPCPMLIEASPSRTMQQLRWIKEIAPYAEDRCQVLTN